ncbi:MAG: hypothetical protein LR015_11980 [Verrucomicrobia bacterium]|nr:hypothetical protein [Verrucomicrobiota bacterium]
MNSMPQNPVSRREFLARGGKISLAALGGLSALQSASGVAPSTKIHPAQPPEREVHWQARGRVFWGSQWQPGAPSANPGLAGVLVSNGVDVVATDHEGRYSLPIEQEGIIHVIKPRGFRVAHNEVFLPQFFLPTSPQGQSG